MKITLRNQQDRIRLSLSPIKNQVKKILLLLNCTADCELSVVFVDDFKIRQLNKTYLKRDRPTDVLAFSAEGSRGLEFNSGLLGDVVISVETARRNAKIFKTNLKRELSLYIIHGILHLLGYDDIGFKDRKKMQKRERELMAKLT